MESVEVIEVVARSYGLQGEQLLARGGDGLEAPNLPRAVVWEKFSVRSKPCSVKSTMQPWRNASGESTNRTHGHWAER
jgi:hypothetical protein